jgi:hypothetical protein
MAIRLYKHSKNNYLKKLLSLVTTFLFHKLKIRIMKNYSKILITIIISSLFVLSSCKKEEVIEGCTDSSAMNYLSNATSNDGSCIFAYDIAQGIWNISSACDDLIISIPLVGDFPVPLNDMFPETIEIIGEGTGVISIDINGENVLADVSYDGTVTIQDGQKVSLDTGDFGVVDVDITGSGKIETATNGDLTLNLSFEVPLAGTQSSSCEITFTR